MSGSLSEQMEGFRVPAPTAIAGDAFLVARLWGIDFDAIFRSPDFEFEDPFDARFGKLMVRTISHLLGRDACGVYGYCELTELSLLLDSEAAGRCWKDASDLQHFLVAMACAKMTLELGTEALFGCRLYAFPEASVAAAYFGWRQQEAYLAGLDGYCRKLLLGDAAGQAGGGVVSGLGYRDKLEILRQHGIDYDELPAWQRYGVGVTLEGARVDVVTELPRDAAYGRYLERFLGA